MLFAVSLGTDELSVKLYAESPPAGITRPLLPFLSNTLLPLRYHPHHPHRLTNTNTLFFFPFESVCPALPAPVPGKGLVAALHPTRRCSPSDGLPAASGPGHSVDHPLPPFRPPRAPPAARLELLRRRPSSSSLQTRPGQFCPVSDLKASAG